jgi:soluble lytic murein transglycosylase-like protein
MLCNQFKFAIRIISFILLLNTIYAKNNSIELLSKYYDKTNIYTQYLIAKNNINNNQDPTLSIKLISKLEDSYIKNDLIRELLDYDMDKKLYIDYIEKFKLLKNTTITNNESCGYNYAQLMLNNNYKITDDYTLYYNNDTKWCSKLVKLQSDHNQISNQQLKFFMFNLIVNSDINFIYNIFHSNILANKNSDYALLYKIKTTAKNDPYLAEELVKDKLLESDIHAYFANYIAYLYARRQNFNMAQMLFEKYPINTYNYNMIEWKAKTFLANLEWAKLINYINQDMPSNLTKKLVWKYWLAIAYKNTNNIKQAQYYFAQIANNSDYYSLLAKSQLNKNSQLIKTLPMVINFTDKNLENKVLSLIELYQLGVNNNNSDIRAIATFEWYFLVRTMSNKNLYNMAGLAKNNGLWELSIIASSKMIPNYLYLSYPLVYLKTYQKYAKMYNIDVSYLLAISRQESRFRNFIIAFDGGIGLMQIMPNTAKYIQKKSKIKSCKTINIDCNINLGSWYLSNLYQKFGDIIYATSSYNAGPKRSYLWQNNLKSLDKTIQIELIPVQITHDYIQNVLVNKAIYDYRLNKYATNFNFLNYINSLKITQNNFDYLNDDNTDKDKMI